MKKLIMIACLLLVGCSSNQPIKQFMTSYYEYVETCQMDEVSLNSESLDYYYQDCARLVPYVDTKYKFVQIEQVDQEYQILIENRTSGKHVLWTVIQKEGKYLVVSFEFK